MCTKTHTQLLNATLLEIKKKTGNSQHVTGICLNNKDLISSHNWRIMQPIFKNEVGTLCDDEKRSGKKLHSSVYSMISFV